MRIISLVPSLTDAVAALGAASELVAVTKYCVHGAPESAERIGGTKNPDIQRVIALRPDVVLANTEENQPEHLQRLRDAGIAVEETYPRTVRDCITLTRRLGQVVGAADRAEVLAGAIVAAIESASWPEDSPRVMALTLIWRKPWMGVGPTTYISDLLWTCGFGNVLAGFAEPYPKLDPSFVLGPDVVLLPSEPYAFGQDDLPAVADLVGDDVAMVLVDGQALTWHGPRTAQAITTFADLARHLAEVVNSG
ncbi:MAG TPA: helical backbone metal receptor [Euzebya sp.]|nr:helical backbone metal receptor [Euzebya sp.]